MLSLWKKKKRCYVFEYENILNAVRNQVRTFPLSEDTHTHRRRDSYLRFDVMISSQRMKKKKKENKEEGKREIEGKGEIRSHGRYPTTLRTTMEVVTRIRDYDPENLFVCFCARLQTHRVRET